MMKSLMIERAKNLWEEWIVFEGKKTAIFWIG